MWSPVIITVFTEADAHFLIAVFASSLGGCSRTDTGVHANHYCFNVKTESKIPPRNFIRGVNGYLPNDISILSCEETEDDFHARFSCLGKEYIYKMHCSESKNPFAEDLMLHYRRKSVEPKQIIADNI